ncbi:4-diphosphocytidyl-2C-methyl-D-erythritol kinase [Agarilytica rhodophyticola]|uniref:4-diphosphocytidyl-2C-methyl-D-erythritol kinase n=1 Tax=Agarilytica rhodophyticola TaxID=1737490 RepID=UPI000B345F51|nr:4-diphosphocytidyl-2C-methyl-D-erythritol kinase [Agarilytica rhodophyticola]
MEFIEANHIEWCDMWQQLAQDAINNNDPICLHMGACWEYMGSTENHHHFRHLKHPSTNKKEFIYLERRKKTLAWAS